MNSTKNYTIKITGIANEEARCEYYKNFSDFSNKISCEPIDNPDCLVACNFAHDEYEEFTGPKVFSTYEPFFSMSEKTKKNINVYSYDDDRIFLYNNPDINKRWFYSFGSLCPKEIAVKLKKTYQVPRGRLCCMFASFTYVRPIPNDLIKHRLSFAQAMGDDIDIYGTKWDLCKDDKLKARWKGYAADKFSEIKKYTFNLCFENSDDDGYITEKIHHSFTTGTIPLYWGGGKYLKETIPENCYINCKNRDPQEVYNRIKKMTQEEIGQYKLAAIEYLNSEQVGLYSRRRWVGCVLDRIGKQE